MCFSPTLPNKQVEEKIVFSYKDVKYKTEPYAYVSDKIILPNGTLLMVYSWSESNPSAPLELKEVEHNFIGLPAETIAQNFDAAMAHIA